MLCHVVRILGICLECDLCGTASALNIESEDLDAVVILVLDRLLASVELLAFIDVLRARPAILVTN